MNTKLPVRKTSPEYRKLLLEKRDALVREDLLKKQLPHLHGFKHYWWSRLYFESDKRMNFLTAANQMGKSSVQIRKCIHWATESSLWPKLWPGKEASLFFYLYPSIKLATREYKTKWVKEFLPRGEMRDDAKYGWKPEFKNGEIHAIHFNSGVSVFFLSYAMNVDDLQASTPNAIFCDEEIPVEIYPEILMRLEASKGHFHLCCTPTKGQQKFRDIFERKVDVPDSLVLCVSLYDATKYEDGTPGQYTIAEVKRREALLGSDKEIQLRVYGRFVTIEGLVYSAFDVDRNLKPGGPVPAHYLIYSAVDVGSGGDNNHPAAIAFVAVEMGEKGAIRGRIFKLWRGDGIETANSDILKEYVRLRGPTVVTRQLYDFASKDFQIHAQRAGLAFEPADKGAQGISLLNTLWKTGMLTIDEECEEGWKLINEIENFRTDTRKTHAKDDLCDAVRYAISKINWDFSLIDGPTIPEHKIPAPQKKSYRGEDQDMISADEHEGTINELNGLYGADF